VLVSGWAHVLHAQYKPWGAGSVLYSLQHGALFVTSFVFLMGLLFKVDGVSSSSGTYTALSGIMVALCTTFMAAWLTVIVARVVSLWRTGRSSGSRSGSLNGRRGQRSSTVSDGHGGSVAASDGDGDGDGTGVGGVTSADNNNNNNNNNNTRGVIVGAKPRLSSDFVVVNPLRRPLRDLSCSAATVCDGLASVTADTTSPPLQPAQSFTVAAPVQLSRLQRVLAAQQPVLSTRSADSL
jgi:hypothetical protein